MFTRRPQFFVLCCDQTQWATVTGHSSLDSACLREFSDSGLSCVCPIFFPQFPLKMSIFKGLPIGHFKSYRHQTHFSRLDSMSSITYVECGTKLTCLMGKKLSVSLQCKSPSIVYLKLTDTLWLLTATYCFET